MRKFLIFILVFCAASFARADDSCLWLPNLPGCATGTSVAGHNSIDVTLTGGSIVGAVDQGSPNTLSNAWPVEPTDGTNHATYTSGGSENVNITNSISVSNPSVGTNGSTAPTSSTQIGVSDGTNLQQLVAPIDLGDGVNGNNSIAGVQYLWNGSSFDRSRGDTTSGEWVNVKSSVLPTGASTSSAQTDGSQKSQIVDGSGNVIGSTSNALNVNISSGSVSGTVTANQGTAGASSWLVVQPDTTASGNITSTQSVTIQNNGLDNIGISVTGTWTGTLAVEGSVDGTNFNSTTAAFLANGQLVSNITSNAQYQANISGLASFRIRGNTVGSGTAVIAIRANQGAAMVMLDNPIPAGSATIGNVGVNAGTNIIGKVGIDQTTPGTTNQVYSNISKFGGTSVSLGQTTESASIPVTIASDQVAPKTYQNSSGSFVLNSSLTTVTSESCPSGGVGFILEASSSNGNNIRWALGATATTSSGMRLEPGRDTGYVPVCATISIVSESGTNEYQLTWVKQ